MKLSIVNAAMLLSAASAFAQPTATNLGTLTSGTPVVANPSLAATGDVVWYTFTIGQATDELIFVDIDTEGSTLAPGNDTEIGLFSSDGTLIASDDDDGSGLMSQLSFGGQCGARPAVGGVAYNGRDGTLPAGTYYLSFSGFNSNFANGWSVTSTSANVGSGVLNINYSATTGGGGGPGIFTETCPGTDAGDLPATARAVDGQTGSVAEIRGTIAGNDVDMFRLNICDFGTFRATTVGGTTVDTQLFLFNTDGMGVAVNDDSTGLQSTITNAFVTANGDYLLAVTGYNRDPVDSSGALLWNNTPFASERAPDGPGAANPVASWTGAPAVGTYTIFLTGACFVGGTTTCIADVDDGTGSGHPDGGVTIDDLLYYLAIYGDGNAAADVDNGTFTGTRDGGVTIDDLLYYLSRYASGC